jgi:hypothetical protein
MLNIFLGVISSAFFCLFITFLAMKYRAIAFPIIAGGAARLAFAWIIGLKLAQIQGTTSDAVAFERVAREWSTLPWSDLLNQFDPSHSYVISFLAAILYKLTAPSPIMLNVLNAAVSVYLIVLSFRLTFELFGLKRAKVIAWIVALYPFAILYGSVYRREVFGSLFFTLACLRTASWASTGRSVGLLAAFMFFVLAGIFHGGFMAGILGVALMAVGDVAYAIIGPSRRTNHNQLLSGVIGVVLLAAATGYLLFSGFTLNKVGQLGEISVVEAVESRTVDRVSEGGSSYPSVLTGANPFGNPIIIPGRILYFLMSPFPWDIRAANHLLGLSATAVYLYIVFSIIRSRKLIFSCRKATAVFCITATTLLVFAISVDNVGTSIRHRTKFLFSLVALCAVPQFPRFVFRASNQFRHRHQPDSDQSHFLPARRV